MRILVDTVTFLFAMESPERLSRRAKSILANPSAALELSVISIVEIALKNSSGKIALSKDQLITAQGKLRMKVLPFEEQHSWELFGLALHHRDPFDRQIIAQALSENIPVLTCDPEFLKYRGLEVLW
jgi:PIN domain nuclease of toxin-antitoxin system